MKRREFFGAIGAGLGVPLLASDVCLQDEAGTKLEVYRGGRRIWFVDTGNVNLNDLLGPPRADKIVRCYKNPNECVMIARLPDGDSQP
jgi:hypothetical protein